jgi:hypothetical protein
MVVPRDFQRWAELMARQRHRSGADDISVQPKRNTWSITASACRTLGQIARDQGMAQSGA